MNPGTEIDIGDDDEDEEEVNRTPPLQQGDTSPPGAAAGTYHGGEAHEMQNFGPEQSGISETTPLLSPQANQARAFVEAVYPSADSTKLEAFYEEDPNPDPESTKKLRLMIKMRGKGKRAYPLYTRDSVTGKERINLDLSNEIIRAVGPEAEKQIEEIKKLKKKAKERREAAERQVINMKTKQQLDKDTQELQKLENEYEQENKRLETIEKAGGAQVEIDNERDRIKRLTAKTKREIDEIKKKIKTMKNL